MFKTKKYQVIRGALSKELSNFILNYMLLQRDAVDLMMKHNKLNPHNPFIGTREDAQIPGAYSKYADWVMETLLMYMIPIMKAKTGLDLVPTYSYTRLYEKGNILKRHKDRPSCEVSTTLHLGGDSWPIYMDPSGADFVIDEVKQIKATCDTVGIEFMATVFDEEGLEWINELGVKRYKIASVTAFNEKTLCEKILSFNKPTIISTGKYEKDVFPFGHDKNITYLYCVSEYPTTLDHPKIKSLPKIFNKESYFGYSDHTLGTSVALAAFHRGSQILEKHFTLNQNLQQETQLAHLCSFNTKTLAEFRNLIDESKIFF